MTADEKARWVADEMLKKDFYSQWLGISIIEARAGHCKIQMRVRKEMLNGFGISHGGISFSFADTALAFICNADGRTTLALDANISFIKQAKENDILTAEATQVSKTKRIGIYLIEVKNQRRELVALFKGTSCTLEERQKA